MRVDACMLAALCTAGVQAAGAQFSLDGPVKTPAKQYVTYAAEQQTVAAGRRTELLLHFQIAEGYHINSHVPKGELLQPTELTLAPAEGVRVQPVEYPAGKPYTLSFDPGTVLDVYQDDFVVRVPVVTAAGAHALKGVLRYQACNKAACYPTRALAVDVPFTAR